MNIRTFRGLNRKGEWVYGSFIHNNIDAPAIVYGDGEQQEVDPKTVGQFTGVVVKNTRIFEGDVIKASPRGDKKGGFFKVVYDATYGAYIGAFVCWVDCVGTPHNYPLGELRFNAEVVGNAYTFDKAEAKEAL